MKQWLPFLLLAIFFFACGEGKISKETATDNPLAQKVEQYITALAANNKFSGNVLINKK